MSVDQREAFLADLHVGVVAIERPDGPPLTVPVWYMYEPGGEPWFFTDADTIKARLVTAAGRFSLCVQSETAPYRYVSVEGTASMRPADRDQDLYPMAHRYLGREQGDAFVDHELDASTQLRVSMRPARWFTVDYGKEHA